MTPNLLPLLIGLGLLTASASTFGAGDDPAKGDASTRPATQPVKAIDLDCGQGVRMKLVYVPPGKFMMGSPTDEPGRRDRGDVSETQHEVTLTRGFYLGVYEVTQEQYATVMGANPSLFKGNKHPAEVVSWNDAAAFCRKLSLRTGMQARLPTEAEWEYACRAGTTTAFNTGPTLRMEDANWGSGQDRNIKPVGSYRPNAWGLYDMHGNVWEWCSDWSDPYPRHPVKDPRVESAKWEVARIMRGGSCSSGPEECRSACRGTHLPADHSQAIGFRVALDATSTGEPVFIKPGNNTYTVVLGVAVVVAILVLAVWYVRMGRTRRQRDGLA